MVEVPLVQILGTMLVILIGATGALAVTVVVLQRRVAAEVKKLQQQIDTLDEAVSTLMEVAGVGKGNLTR